MAECDGQRGRRHTNGKTRVAVCLKELPLSIDGRPTVLDSGVLLNANDNISEIEARDGKVLTAPFRFADLYHHYANSWTVPTEQSLLDTCGERKIEAGLPEKPFFAKDLPPKNYKTARRVCVEAGVKTEALLDAGTLDVAVIGSESAAKVYVGTSKPAAVGDADGKRHHHDHDHDHDRDR
jgi:hypothetical protein